MGWMGWMGADARLLRVSLRGWVCISGGWVGGCMFMFCGFFVFVHGERARDGPEVFGGLPQNVGEMAGEAGRGGDACMRFLLVCCMRVLSRHSTAAAAKLTTRGLRWGVAK